MRPTKSLLLIAGLLLLFCTLAVFLARSSRRDPIRDHSSLRTNAWGTKALAELCRASGLKAVTWDKSTSALTDGQQVLCLFDPSLSLDRYQVQGLLDWVKQGGVLLVGADLEESHNLTLAMSATSVGPDEALLAALGLRLEKARYNECTQSVLPTGPELREVKALYVPSPYRLRPGTTAEFSKLEQSLSARERERLRVQPLAPLSWESLVSDETGSILLRAVHGRGRLYALAEVEMFANKHLEAADNVVLAANLLFAPRAPKVYFDERIHVVRVGLSEDARELDPALALWTLYAVLLALALYLSSRGWRFGAPVPPANPPRRSALEFVNALADLYRRAGARQAVLDLLRQSFRRKLAAAAGIAADLPSRTLATAVAARRPVDEKQLLALLLRLEPTGTQPSEQELLALSRQMAEIEEALTHGRRHR